MNSDAIRGEIERLTTEFNHSLKTQLCHGWATEFTLWFNPREGSDKAKPVGVMVVYGQRAVVFKEFGQSPEMITRERDFEVAMPRILRQVGKWGRTVSVASSMTETGWSAIAPVDRGTDIRSGYVGVFWSARRQKKVDPAVFIKHEWEK